MEMSAEQRAETFRAIKKHTKRLTRMRKAGGQYGQEAIDRVLAEINRLCWSVY